MRLIDADVLIADLDKGLWGKDYDKALAEAIIQDAPSIEIIRCRECKWFDDKDYGEPTRYCTWHESVVNADDFCSYGERREP